MTYIYVHGTESVEVKHLKLSGPRGTTKSQNELQRTSTEKRLSTLEKNIEKLEEKFAMLADRFVAFEKQISLLLIPAGYDTLFAMSGRSIENPDTNLTTVKDNTNSKTIVDEAIEEKWSMEIQQNLVEEIECCLMVGRKSKANFCLRTLKLMMTSPSGPCTDDVMKTCDDYVDSSSYIRALILLQCVSNLYKIDADPTKAIRGINECNHKTMQIIGRLVQQGGSMLPIARSFGIGCIEKLLYDLRSVTGIDEYIKVLYEALSLNNIGYSCDDVGEYRKAIEFYKEGMNILSEQFKSDANKYRVFGDLHNNSGISYYNMGNSEEARKFYLIALECYKEASDWESVDVKEEEISITRNNLEMTEELVGKKNA
ncbi:uncharacterized protein LOC120346176 [Styela clava]